MPKATLVLLPNMVVLWRASYGLLSSGSSLSPACMCV